MNRMLHIAMLAAATPLTAIAGTVAPGASASFSTEVRIEVGQDGQVTDVVPDRALSPVLEKAVRSHVATWRFQAPVRDGRPVSGTTYAFVTGCAVPSPEGLALSFARTSNGPGHGTQGIIGTHMLPIGELGEGSFKVNVDYRVQPDGSVSVDAVQSDGRRSRAMRAFEKGIGKWLADRRFLPEKVDGQPVVTRMAYPITYELQRVRPGAKPPQNPAADSACRMAAEGATTTSQRPVAIDSPFQLVPAG